MKKFIKNLRKFISSPLKGTSGYSLTELSISTSIIAVLAVGGLSVLGKKNDQDKLNLTKTNMATIETAIKGFIRTKGYIPCPALPALLETNVNFGKSEGLTTAGSITTGYPDDVATGGGVNESIFQTTENYSSPLTATSYDGTRKCNKNGLRNETGAVPVRTLGLADSMAYDGWGRKFTFRTASASGSKIDFNYPNFKGNIAIIDLKGTNKTSIHEPPPFNDGAIYVLISHGANGKAVAHRKNNSTLPSPATGIEAKNTDHKRPLYIQNDKNTAFDDIVIFGTNSKLGRQKITESPVRLPDIACQNAQMITNNKRADLNAFASSGAYSTRADTVFKSATILGNLCQNRKNAETIGPSRINGLQLWLDANDKATLYGDADCSGNGMPANGATIGCWRDKSENKRNATSTVSSYSPIYNTGSINGKPTITFDGGNNHYMQGGFSVGQSKMTIFGVMRDNTIPGAGWDNSVFSTDGYRGLNKDANDNIYTLQGDGGLGAYTISSGRGVTAIVTVIYSTTTDSSGRIFYNGKLEGTTPLNPVVSVYAASNYQIAGRTWGNQPTRVFKGDISEVIVYNTELSTTDQNKIEEYLSDKWGIPLASSTSTCTNGMFFQKTPEDPMGSCKCPAGQSYIPDLVTANACYPTPNNTYFGKCVTKTPAPDYNGSPYSTSTPVSYSPDKGGMQLWLDAADCTTIVLEPITPSKLTTTVKTWKDKSGLANDAVQNTTANQPLYVQNVINSKPVLRFDGVNDHIVSNLVANITTTELSYFVVAKRIAFQANASVLNGSAPGWQHDYDSSDAFVGFYEGDAVSLAMTRNYGNSTVMLHPGNGVAYIASSIFNGVNNIVALNGVAFSPTISSATNTAFNTNRLRVGSRWISNAEAQFYSGDVAEIIVYNKALSTKERTNIEDYLSNKWDIIRYPDHKVGTTDLSQNLKLWLDANDATTIYKDAICSQAAAAWDSVGCWKDKSGGATPNNNHATQATTARRPTYASGSQNGLPAIGFNGVSTYLQNSSFPNLGGKASIFVVAKSINTYGVIIEFNNNGTNNTGTSIFGEPTCCGTNAGIKFRVMGPDLTITDNTAALPAINLFEGITDGSSMYLYKAGTQKATGSVGSIPTINRFDIGTLPQQIPAQYFLNGYIAEIVVYNIALNTTQRQSIERYLGGKWGITLP